MTKFTAWIAGTWLSAQIQNVAWIIPAVQIIHILSVSVVMSSVLVLDLRLVGLLARSERMDIFTQRYLPWVWRALAILFLSGATLIIGEPDRDLNNPVFWAKMSLLAVATLITLFVERPVLRDAHFWETGNRRFAVRVLAAIALICWISIVFCGRWIAYTYTD
jgi:hypothetical protein